MYAAEVCVYTMNTDEIPMALSTAAKNIQFSDGGRPFWTLCQGISKPEVEIAAAKPEITRLR